MAKPHLPVAFTRTAIGERLAEVRKAKDLKAVQFCEPVGIAANTYSQWEKGVRLPNLEDIVRVCDHYGCTLDFVYRGKMDAMPHDLAAAISELRARYPSNEHTPKLQRKKPSRLNADQRPERAA